MRAYDTGEDRSVARTDRTPGTFDFYRRRLTQERAVPLSPEARRIVEGAAVNYAELKADTHPHLYREFMDWLNGPYASSVGSLSISPNTTEQQAMAV